jgi:HEAT repeat protein
MSTAERIKRRLKRRLLIVAGVFAITFGPCLVVGVIVGVGRMLGIFAPGPPPPPPDRPIVARLKGDFAQQEAALRELLQTTPDRQQRDTVAAVKGVLRFGTPQLKIEALKVLALWGQAEDAAAVTPLLDGKWPGMAAQVVKTLGQLKGPAAAQALVDQLGKEQHDAAVQELRGFGKDAEKPLLSRIKSDDPRVRKQVCELLGELGTEASVPALRQATEDADLGVRDTATGALEKLK